MTQAAGADKLRVAMQNHPIEPDPAGAPDTPLPAGRRYLLKGQAIAAPVLVPGLHLVATPDRQFCATLRFRALETLAAADLIACEDTRVTRQADRALRHHHPRSRPITSTNAAEARPKLDGAARAGRRGWRWCRMPARRSSRIRVFKLAREAGVAGHAVTAVPGASAVLAALTISGPADRPLHVRGIFCRRGKASGAKRIDEIKLIPATLVLFRDRPAHRRRTCGPGGRARARAKAAVGARAHQILRGGAPRRSGEPRRPLCGRRRAARARS